MAYNFCDKCGFRLTQNARFCANCGAQVTFSDDLSTQEEALVPTQILSPTEQASSVNYQSVAQMATTPVSFPLGEHTIEFDVAIKDYIELSDSFVDFTLARVKDFTEFYRNNVHNFDDLYEKALPRYIEIIAYLFKHTEIILESYGLNIPAENILQISESYFDVSSTFGYYQETTKQLTDYANRLASYRAAKRSRQYSWGSIGFGLSGAIKGAMTAAALNAGTDFIRGMSHSIVDSADRARFGNMKKKLFTGEDHLERLSSDIRTLGRNLFALANALLVSHGILNQCEFHTDDSARNGDKAYATVANCIMKNRLPGESERQSVFDYAYRSIEQDPRIMSGYLAVYLISDSKEEIFAICDYFGLRTEFLNHKNRKFQELVQGAANITAQNENDFQRKIDRLVFLQKIEPDETSDWYSSAEKLILKIKQEKKEYEEQKELDRQRAIREKEEEEKRRAEQAEAEAKAKVWKERLENDRVSATTTKKIVEDYIVQEDWNALWDLVRDGCVLAEYALTAYYLDLTSDAIKKMDVTQVNQIAAGIREYAKQRIVFAQYIIAFIYFYFWAVGIENDEKALEMLPYCVQAANRDCVSAMFLLVELNLYGENEEYENIISQYEKTPAEYLEYAAEHQHPEAMWRYGMQCKNEAGSDLELQAKAEYFLEMSKQYGFEPPEQSSNKHGSSDCFITSAVCTSFGKPDDCYELTAFRKFRDEWLANEPDGSYLIKKYYLLAPLIVDSVNSTENSKEIYKEIWTDYLSPCLSYIEAGEYAKCKENYCKMVDSLRRRYLNREGQILYATRCRFLLYSEKRQ